MRQLLSATRRTPAILADAVGKRGKYRIAMVIIGAIAGLPALPLALAGNQCSAQADAASPKPIKSNKYWFPFDVHAKPCTEYACNGFVKFAIRYHYSGSTTSVVDRTLVQYRIPAGNSQVRVALEHWVGSVDSNVTLDDVAVEEVSCSAP